MHIPGILPAKRRAARESTPEGDKSMGKRTRPEGRGWFRRLLSGTLAWLMLLTALGGTALAAGPAKDTVSRAIAIVFDNSGSMYAGSNMAWCRATYAIEVFASMMNQGDTLQVFPMYEVTAKGKSYTSQSPVTVSGGGDISVIREMYTPHAGDTPIETIGDAHQALQRSSADEKWLIVLTDGAEFYENNVGLGSGTAARLSEVLTEYNKSANVLYLGIGSVAVMPSVTGNGQYQYYADKASNSADVLSKLTNMCNMIFGRDELAAAGSQISFDVSMNKLILFVQGSSISGVTLKDSSGASVGNPSLEYDPRYSEKGAGTGIGSGTFGIDTSLSGYIAIYDMPLEAGTYTLGYAGNVTNVSVYYEPDVDLVAQLTDESGAVVTASSQLYPGTYYLNYGLVDKDGNMTTSALLGTTSYEVTYILNGKEEKVSSDKSGQVALELKEGDVLEGKIHVSYLSGYSITKDSSQLGWPAGGFQVSPRPAGTLELKVSGGQASYSLSRLEETPYQLQVWYDGAQLTGQDLEQVTFTAALEGGNAGYELVREGNSCALYLRYAGSAEATQCGDYHMTVQASYTDEFGVPAQSNPAELDFTLEDDSYQLAMDIQGAGYFVIGDLERSDPILVKLTLSGQPMTDEQLAATALTVEGGGLTVTQEPVPGQSAYALHIVKDDQAVSGRYNLHIRASTTDQLGRQIAAEGDKGVELQPYPLWLRYLLIALIILLIIALILFYLSRKILPKKIAVNSAQTVFTVDGEMVQGAAKCNYSGGGKKRGSIQVSTPAYSGSPLVKGGFALQLQAVTPRRVKSARRRALVTSISPSNTAALTSLSIGTHTLVKSEEGNEIIWVLDGKQVPSPSAATKFEIGGKPTCTFIGETITGESFTLSVQLQFK